MIRPVRWRKRQELLTSDQVRSIHQASLRILERTGVCMPLSQARRDQAQDLGLAVDQGSGRVRFPPAVIESALEKAPRTFALCARDPANDVVLDGQRGFLCLDGSAAEMLDHETGRPRPSRKSDLEAAVRVADSLPQVAFLWPCLSARDQPAAVQCLHELEALLCHSTKHAQAMTVVDPVCAQAAVAMAAEVAGGPEALRRRPLISTFQCSVSPLSFEERALQAALVFGEAGIPTGFWSMTIGAGTAPITVAGNAALANAEILAGMALFQLLCPGVPTFYGTSASMMELRFGGVACGGPEDCLLQAAGCQLAHFYGVPASVGTFAAGAKSSGWQAGVENALSGAVSLLAGADMMPGAGLLHSARVFSLEQLLLDCELFDMIRVVSEGMEVDEDTLAVDLIDAVGPGGHYLAEGHTLAHLREVWQPKLMDRLPWDEWERQGRPAPADRARAEAQRIVSTHAPTPLPCADVLAEIVEEVGRRLAGGR